MTRSTRSVGRPVAAAVLAGLALALVACGERRSFELDAIPFGDANLHAVWSPGPLAFSAAEVQLFIDDGSGRELLYETRIGNDGGTLDWDNLRPAWDASPELVLCINGDEQDDVSVAIDLDTREVTEETRPCTK